MKHHQYNPNFKFAVVPVNFNKFTEKSVLQYCLGATLYMPGTKKVVDKILNKKIPGLTSMVMCLEDSIRKNELDKAEKNVIKTLDTLSTAIGKGEINTDDIPLIFIRVRNLEQFKNFTQYLNKDRADSLTGFVFPKFCSNNGYDYYSVLNSLNNQLSSNLYGMPILEGREIAYRESRVEELQKLLVIFRTFKHLTLNIRVGGTDFSSFFGVRRGINYSIYDILPVRDCLSDILNFFNRQEENFITSAPVWEYFLADKTENLENLIEDDIQQSILQRSPIVNEAVDGLLREVVLDKANGFIGKTIIHPSHLKYVNAMQAVTKEEYEDSCQILNEEGGVVKANKGNKMNEINPHANWATKISYRAKAYGVIENEAAYIKLFK